MSEPTYISIRKKITKAMYGMFETEMKKATLREIRLAKAAGDVTSDEMPFITVIFN